MTNHDFKSLSDAINHCKDEQEKELLLEQFNLMHMEAEALKAEDERNYVEFDSCR